VATEILTTPPRKTLVKSVVDFLREEGPRGSAQVRILPRNVPPVPNETLRVRFSDMTDFRFEGLPKSRGFRGEAIGDQP